jgi:hypothetical protein
MSRLRRIGRASPFRAIALLGHSASGKSSVAARLGLRRQQCDYDIVIRDCGGDYEQAIRILARPDNGLIILPNNRKIIPRIRRDLLAIDSGIGFVYLQRPREVIRTNLGRVNADGRRHPAIEDFPSWYAGFEESYLPVSDYVLHSDAADLGRLASDVGSLMSELTDFHRPPPRDDDMPESKMEYAEYVKVAEANQAGIPKDKLLSQAEMKKITAGGYQVFDTGYFPPVAAPGSICQKKLGDLKWRPEDFAGRTVLELGSQLGFFGFTALSFGARRVVGLDLNPRFVAEANKIAIHYKALCGWETDRIRFRTHAIEVGESYPESPDVIVANSIVHWFFIHGRKVTLREVFGWLRDNVNFALYFEGCVTADETIMRQHKVDIGIYNERLFLDELAAVFSKVDFVGRCSYNPKRIVVRAYK